MGGGLLRYLTRFASGYDFRTPEGYAEMMEFVHRTIGLI